jgi:glc operon protein GlcG
MLHLSTLQRPSVSMSSALALCTHAIEVATNAGLSMSVVVVGSSLEKVALVSMDAATPHSRETSLKKAQTAASTRRPTGWMPAGLAVELPLASGGLLTNIPGGFPIKIDGIVVGGLGVAGGTVEQDAQIAAAVLSAFGADPS